MAGRDRTVEQIIAGLATRRHGVVTRRQLLGAGVTRDEIDGRVARGALITVHRGVYRAGHAAPSAEATYTAAVLACGAGALLGGSAAGWMAGLVDGDPAPATVWAPTERRVPGVRCRRLRVPPADGRWVVRGVPVVSLARMLVEMAAEPAADLSRAFHAARTRHGLAPASVLAILPRNAPGAQRLRAVMLGDELDLSRLERRFRRLLREHGLPAPRMNQEASGRYVDCRWPDARLTVELDSYTFHASRHAWERDRRREREAYARGDQFRRYTWGDVFEHPGPMLAELRALLS